MIATPYVTAGVLWAVAMSWPSASQGHTLSDPTRFRSLDACLQALPKYEAAAREARSRGTPICVEVKS